MEQVGVFLHEMGQYPASVGVVLACVAEYVVPFAVSVQVETDLCLPLLAVRHYLFLELEQVGVEYTRRLLPSAVEINPAHITAEIAIYHSIHVNHREHLHHIVLQNVFSFSSALEQASHESLCHK